MDVIKLLICVTTLLFLEFMFGIILAAQVHNSFAIVLCVLNGLGLVANGIFTFYHWRKERQNQYETTPGFTVEGMGSEDV
jgi:hypothetical protein